MQDEPSIIARETAGGSGIQPQAAPEQRSAEMQRRAKKRKKK